MTNDGLNSEVLAILAGVVVGWLLYHAGVLIFTPLEPAHCPTCDLWGAM